jgi:hypothetical protein
MPDLAPPNEGTPDQQINNHSPGVEGLRQAEETPDNQRFADIANPDSESPFGVVAAHAREVVMSDFRQHLSLPHVTMHR